MIFEAFKRKRCETDDQETQENNAPKDEKEKPSKRQKVDFS